MNTNLEYVIVQAGGKGTRLERLTRNKPKALVSINNAPMIFHLFRKFPNAKYNIIGDYKFDVLNKYLNAFADVDLNVVNASNFKGTCAGLQECLKSIPDDKPFMLIWCDLVLAPDFNLDNLNIENENYIGLSQDFPCRWKFENGVMEELPSQEFGIAGLFIFKNKQCLKDVPQEGEFVQWLSKQNINFKIIGLKGGAEYGLIKVVEGLEKPKCRPFNKLTFVEDKIIKEGIDEQGLKLAEREKRWYKVVADKNFKNLPKIYSFEPLTMARINGGSIYEYSNLPDDDKREILVKLVNCLKEVHKLGEIPADKISYDDNYIDKTLSRLEKVRDLAPFAKDEFITINGKKCKNIFYCIDSVKEQMDKYFPENFVFLHGDCTFSNILLNENKEPVLIDPRGYFGKTELYGDVAYDWAKLYYSLVSNYDQFNLKNFELNILEDSVELNIPNNNWESLKDFYIELVKDDVSEEQLNLILALIWLSLTTYAWDDYDSICGAFYKGILILNECNFINEVK